MKLDLTKLPSFTTFASAQDTCGACGAMAFAWLTNGDGGLLQVCQGCGQAWGVGRFYCDKAIGPRAESIWSAGVARTP